MLAFEEFFSCFIVGNDTLARLISRHVIHSMGVWVAGVVPKLKAQPVVERLGFSLWNDASHDVLHEKLNAHRVEKTYNI